MRRATIPGGDGPTCRPRLRLIAWHSVGSQAVEKFKQAISIDGKRHDAQWCLGNAYTSQVHTPCLVPVSNSVSSTD